VGAEGSRKTAPGERELKHKTKGYTEKMRVWSRGKRGKSNKKQPMKTVRIMIKLESGKGKRLGGKPIGATCSNRKKFGPKKKRMAPLRPK